MKGRGWPNYAWIWVEVNTDEGITVLENPPIDGVVEAITKLGRKIDGDNPFNIEKFFKEALRSGCFLPAISEIEMAL